MTDRPILFSGEMVRAILLGRKTQTRRVLKVSAPPEAAAAQYVVSATTARWCWISGFDGSIASSFDVPYAPDDRLWVREAFTLTQYGKPVYRADARDQTGQRWSSIQPGDPDREVRWKPSIHMPRSASRITLVVDEVRIQRLREISAKDTIAEGVQCETCMAMIKSACGWSGCYASKQAFRRLWDSLNADRGYGWDDNPWVVAVSFSPIFQNIDEI